MVLVHEKRVGTMEIDIRQLVAVCKYAACKEKGRNYLCSVHFAPAGSDWLHIVALDGHRMVVWRVPNTDGFSAPFTVPRSLLDNLKIPARAGRFATLTHDGQEARLDLDEFTVGAPLRTDWMVPYERLRPEDDVEPAPARFNGRYCADFEALADAFDTDVTITPRGRFPALVTFGRPDLYGALMPMRGEFALRAPF